MKVRIVWGILRDAASEWVEDNATRLSAALAFYAILSVAPLIVIVTSIAGFAFGDTAPDQIVNQLRGHIGDAGAEVVKTAIEKSNRPAAGTLAAVIGIVTLLFAASGVFGELQSALNTVWNVKTKPGRGFWRTVRARFLSFGMVLVVGFLLLVSLVVSTALAALGTVLLQVANLAVSFAVVAALFAAIYKFLPDVHIGWKDVWLGAIVTAILFTIGKLFISLYLGHVAVGTPFGAAGSLAVFIVWIYYSGLILFFGAELTQVTVKHFGRKIEPAANAMPADKGADQ